jgi:hypothetical protein
MTAGGWLMMFLSVSSVLALCIFCVSRVLLLPRHEAQEHLTAPLEIDTRDTYDAD